MDHDEGGLFFIRPHAIAGSRDQHVVFPFVIALALAHDVVLHLLHRELWQISH